VLKSIRRILLCAALSAGLGVLTPAAAVRADEPPLTQDYNKFWQVMEAPTPPCPPDPLHDDYNTYWQKVQIQQDYQQLHPQQ
jgi:hypothetical protein